jgi:hypothetical protein
MFTVLRKNSSYLQKKKYYMSEGTFKGQIFSLCSFSVCICHHYAFLSRKSEVCTFKLQKVSDIGK